MLSASSKRKSFPVLLSADLSKRTRTKIERRRLFLARSFFFPFKNLFLHFFEEKSSGDNKVCPYLYGMTLSKLQTRAEIAFSHPISPTHLPQKRKDRCKHLLSKAGVSHLIASSKESIVISVMFYWGGFMLRNTHQF